MRCAGGRSRTLRLTQGKPTWTVAREGLEPFDKTQGRLSRFSDSAEGGSRTHMDARSIAF